MKTRSCLAYIWQLHFAKWQDSGVAPLNFYLFNMLLFGTKIKAGKKRINKGHRNVKNLQPALHHSRLFLPNNSFPHFLHSLWQALQGLNDGFQFCFDPVQ